MNSRQLIALGFAVLVQPCLARGILPQHDGNEHLGVQSCAATSCHGSAGERNTYAVLQNEYITWARHDMHARAYEVLKNEQSQRIAANLDLESAHTAKICLDCHTDNVHRERRGLQFDLADGVACEACHGGAERWLGVHISGGGDKHAESLAAGMYPTEDPEARAELCLSCHLGTADKFVSHKILGAGHPRLSFDLQKFTDLQPRHYRVDADYRERKNYVEDTRVWAIGQVEAAREYLVFLQGPRMSAGGMFPELGLFDCHACHHAFKDQRWKANERSGTPPGTVLLNDSSLAMAHVVASVIDPPSAAAMLGAIRDLHRGSQTDVVTLRAAAAKLDRQLVQLADSLKNMRFDRDRNRRIIEALTVAVGEGRFSDYSDAEQATMALEVYSGVTGLYKDEVDALYETVADIEVTDAKRFDPERFAAVFKRPSAVTPAAVTRQAERAERGPAPLTQKPVSSRPATRPPEAEAVADEPVTADAADAPESLVPTHVVDTQVLRVRFSPEAGSRIAVLLDAGDEVQQLSRTGTWTQIAYESNGAVRTGWVASRLLAELSGAAQAAAIIPAPVAKPSEPKPPATRPLVTEAPLPVKQAASRPASLVPTHFVDTGVLRVRFSPDTNARIAVLLYAGDEVQWLEKSGSWSRIAYDSNGVVRTGWVASRLIVDRSTAANRPAPPTAPQTRAEQPAQTPPPATTSPAGGATHSVNSSALRVRFAADGDAGVRDTLYFGDRVRVLDSSGDWSQVSYTASGGVTRVGFVASAFLDPL